MICLSFSLFLSLRNDPGYSARSKWRIQNLGRRRFLVAMTGKRRTSWTSGRYKRVEILLPHHEKRYKKKRGSKKKKVSDKNTRRGSFGNLIRSNLVHDPSSSTTSPIPRPSGTRADDCSPTARSPEWHRPFCGPPQIFDLNIHMHDTVVIPSLLPVTVSSIVQYLNNRLP